MPVCGVRQGGPAQGQNSDGESGPVGGAFKPRELSQVSQQVRAKTTARTQEPLTLSPGLLLTLSVDLESAESRVTAGRLEGPPEAAVEKAVGRGGLQARV